MSYYEKLVVVGAVIAVLAIIYVINWVSFEAKIRRQKHERRSRQNKT